VKSPLQSLKTAFVTGLLIILPAWLALLLLLKVLAQLGVLVKPIADKLPDSINHPQLIAVVLFILLCLLAGMLVHTTAGQTIGKSVGDHVLNRIPGYEALRNIARQFSNVETTDGFKPALIEVEDGCLAPAFLIENHENGQSTVFMPSVPTPMAGAIFIMPSDRVHPIDVPVTTMMKCISKWGEGTSELLASLKSH
jgi:uncharacterized membrane protein